MRTKVNANAEIMWVLGQFSETEVRNQQSAAHRPGLVDLPPVCIMTVLLEHNHTHSFTRGLFKITTELSS